jgi:hypothetical protein
MSRRRHEAVPATALAKMPKLIAAVIRNLDCQRPADDSRAREVDLRAEMLHDR